MSTLISLSPRMVRDVIDVDNLTDDDLEGHIATALALYDEHLVNSTISVRLQLEIKKYLAAHFASLRDPSTMVQSETIGDARIDYVELAKAPVDKSLLSTRWGQVAISLDPTGILKHLGGTPPAVYAL